MKKHILLVEDDLYLREGLEELLVKEDYLVTAVENIEIAKKAKEKGCYDLIILDIRLPDGNGVDLCRQWRYEGVVEPILFLTAFDDEMQVVRALDSGGNDYVPKPFRMQELLSRIRALLRKPLKEKRLNSAITLDTQRIEVRKNNQLLYVTPTEFKILLTLVNHQGQIVTRKSLLEKIWDSTGQFIDDNTLSVHVSRLREKVGHECIVTYRGIGYKWEGHDSD